MTEHTPGPWRYRPHEFDDWGVVRAPPQENGYGYCVAQARAGRHVPEEELDEHRRNKTDPYGANARLIAAAPDMLAALQAVMNELRLFVNNPSAWEGHYSDAMSKRLRIVVKRAEELIAKATGAEGA